VAGRAGLVVAAAFDELTDGTVARRSLEADDLRRGAGRGLVSGRVQAPVEALPLVVPRPSVVRQDGRTVSPLGGSVRERS
jgi:hypothetical protein